MRNKSRKKKSLVKTILKIFCALIIISILSVLLINVYVRRTAKKNFTTTQELSETEPADAVLVLGALVNDSGSLVGMLKERVDKGIEIYENGQAKKILMTGDHGQTDYDEVNAMKAYAIEKGVPSEDIFMDHAGFSTYESMYRAKAIFEIENIIVVTQEYHLYRAVYNANTFGLTAKGVPCDVYVYNGETQRKVREAAAIVKDFGYGVIKIKPTYLGETIPITGNGDTTND